MAEVVGNTVEISPLSLWERVGVRVSERVGEAKTLTLTLSHWERGRLSWFQAPAWEREAESMPSGG